MKKNFNNLVLKDVQVDLELDTKAVLTIYVHNWSQHKIQLSDKENYKMVNKLPFQEGKITI